LTNKADQINTGWGVSSCTPTFSKIPKQALPFLFEKALLWG